MSEPHKPEQQEVAIVSGAARGLGAAFALALHNAGYQVLGFDVDPSSHSNPHYDCIQADVSQRSDVAALLAHVSTLGPLRVVVNNAGIWRRSPVTSSLAQALDDYNAIINTNVKGVLMLSRASVPLLVAAGGGHIINVSSHDVLPPRSADTHPPDTDLYTASKWALNGFTDAWAKTLAPHNISVNGMCMGAVDTPMLGDIAAAHTPDEGACLNAAELGNQLLEIMASGRSGENFGAWPGHSLALEPAQPVHQHITG